MKKSIGIVLGMLFAAGFAVSSSCGDDPATEEAPCPVGTENCPCVSDACNGDLVCEADKCVAPSVDSETTEIETESERDTNPTKSDIQTTNDADGKICATGVVVGPTDDSGWQSHWGAGFGINFCQAASNADKTPLGECPTDLSALKGFRLTVTGDLPSELRVQFEDNFEGNDEVVGDNGYIVAESVDEPVDYLFADAAVFYLAEDSRPELQPALFTSVQFQIASHMGEIETFDFCIQDIEVILAEETPDGGVDDTDVPTDVVEPSTDPACADPASLKIIPDENSRWVAGCSNAAGLQGDLYEYSDPG